MEWGAVLAPPAHEETRADVAHALWSRTFDCDGCNLGSMNSDPWGPRLETRPVSVLTAAAQAARDAGQALNRMSYQGFRLGTAHSPGFLERGDPGTGAPVPKRGPTGLFEPSASNTYGPPPAIARNVCGRRILPAKAGFSAVPRSALGQAPAAPPSIAPLRAVFSSRAISASLSIASRRFEPARRRWGMASWPTRPSCLRTLRSTRPRS